MNITTKFAFTICSNNYLGQANALKESFLTHNPTFTFYIILVDKRSEQVDYTNFNPAQILTIAEIDGLDLPDLISRYDIIELNTSIKPSVFKHIISNNINAEVIYYLDPDLYFYDTLEEVTTILKTKNAVLTPHILSEIPRDGMLPDENIFLKFGIYNLGFIGINVNSEFSLKMLDWWEERTIHHGYNWPKIGYFVDQLWMALAPIFFDNVEILKTFNYNMAPWNLHERRIISIKGNKVLLNDETNLVFYHFSKLANNDKDISREYNRYTFEDFPLLKELYNNYQKTIESHHYTNYKNIPIGYDVRQIVSKKYVKGSLLKRLLKRLALILNNTADKA
ncbi:hypothetical protein ACFQO1_04115 [Jejudonia soesokkakensis]|uniref:Glycosyl transferase n=1 Tax=Jejudonia soesokkakensis TaxID=1323432 RepID=A0ABW2MRZ7_9FLAO